MFRETVRRDESRNAKRKNGWWRNEPRNAKRKFYLKNGETVSPRRNMCFAHLWFLIFVNKKHPICNTVSYGFLPHNNQKLQHKMQVLTLKSEDWNSKLFYKQKEFTPRAVLRYHYQFVRPNVYPKKIWTQTW